MELEISNRRKPGRFTNLWKLNITHLNNHGVKEKKIRKENKNIVKQMKMETQHTKTYGT